MDFHALMYDIFWIFGYPECGEAAACDAIDANIQYST